MNAMIDLEDKTQKILTDVKDILREAKEKKATGQATVTVDLHQGGITSVKVGLVRITK